VEHSQRVASYDTSLVVSGGVDCRRRRRNVYDKKPQRYAKDLQLCDKFVSSKQVPLYTFFTATSQHTSFINHFLVSSTLASMVVKSDILDSGSNFSDHLAVTLAINCNISAKTNRKCKNRTPPTTRLRWDKADFNTYSMLQQVVVTGLSDSNYDNVQTIDRLYEAICYCLNMAATGCVPVTRGNFFKS